MFGKKQSQYKIHNFICFVVCTDSVPLAYNHEQASRYVYILLNMAEKHIYNWELILIYGRCSENLPSNVAHNTPIWLALQVQDTIFLLGVNYRSAYWRSSCYFMIFLRFVKLLVQYWRNNSLHKSQYAVLWSGVLRCLCVLLNLALWNDTVAS